MKRLKAVFKNFLIYFVCLNLLSINPYTLNKSFAQSSLKAGAKAGQNSANNQEDGESTTEEEKKDFGSRMKKSFVDNDCAWGKKVEKLKEDENNFKDCDEIEDSNEKKKCVTGNVGSYLKEKEEIDIGPNGQIRAGNDEEQEKLKKIGCAAEKLGWVTMLLDLVSRDILGTCMSSRIAMIAGLVGLGDLGIMLFADIKLRELQYEYWSKQELKEDKGSPDSSQSQKDAFIYLKKELDELIKIDAAKIFSFSIQTGFHAAAVGLAAYETISLAMGNPVGACLNPSTGTNGLLATSDLLSMINKSSGPKFALAKSQTLSSSTTKTAASGKTTSSKQASSSKLDSLDVHKDLDKTLSKKETSSIFDQLAVNKKKRKALGENPTGKALEEKASLKIEKRNLEQKLFDSSPREYDIQKKTFEEVDAIEAKFKEAPPELKQDFAVIKKQMQRKTLNDSQIEVLNSQIMDLSKKMRDQGVISKNDFDSFRQGYIKKKQNLRESAVYFGSVFRQNVSKKEQNTKTESDDTLISSTPSNTRTEVALVKDQPDLNLATTGKKSTRPTKKVDDIETKNSWELVFKKKDDLGQGKSTKAKPDSEDVSVSMKSDTLEIKKYKQELQAHNNKKGGIQKQIDDLDETKVLKDIEELKQKSSRLEIEKNKLNQDLNQPKKQTLTEDQAQLNAKIVEMNKPKLLKEFDSGIQSKVKLEKQVLEFDQAKTKLELEKLNEKSIELGNDLKNLENKLEINSTNGFKEKSKQLGDQIVDIENKNKGIKDLSLDDLSKRKKLANEKGIKKSIPPYLPDQRLNIAQRAEIGHQLSNWTSTKGKKGLFKEAFDINDKLTASSTTRPNNFKKIGLDGKMIEDINKNLPPKQRKEFKKKLDDLVEYYNKPKKLDTDNKTKNVEQSIIDDKIKSLEPYVSNYLTNKSGKSKWGKGKKITKAEIEKINALYDQKVRHNDLISGKRKNDQDMTALQGKRKKLNDEINSKKIELDNTNSSITKKQDLIKKSGDLQASVDKINNDLVITKSKIKEVEDFETKLKSKRKDIDDNNLASKKAKDLDKDINSINKKIALSKTALDKINVLKKEKANLSVPNVPKKTKTKTEISVLNQKLKDIDSGKERVTKMKGLDDVDKVIDRNQTDNDTSLKDNPTSSSNPRRGGSGSGPSKPGKNNNQDGISNTKRDNSFPNKGPTLDPSPKRVEIPSPSKKGSTIQGSVKKDIPKRTMASSKPLSGNITTCVYNT